MPAAFSINTPSVYKLLTNSVVTSIQTAWCCSYVVRAQDIASGSSYKNSYKIEKKRNKKKTQKNCCLFLDFFFKHCENRRFSPVFAFRLKMHVRCDNQLKTGAERGTVFGQPMLLECRSIDLRLSPAHECEIKGSLVYLLIVKFLSHRFCLHSATVY